MARVDIRAMLEVNGWEMREAENGRDGLDQAAERRPEVVVLDLNMPVMDGFESLKAFRALPACAAVPVVVLTARDLSLADCALLHGGDPILNPNIASPPAGSGRGRGGRPAGRVSRNAR